MDGEGLSGVPLFSELGPEAFASIVGAVDRVRARAGDHIVEEGGPGDAMYVIARGRVRVERRLHDGGARVVDEIGEGDIFGEMALVARAPRFATVVAVTDVDLWRLDRDRLAALARAHPGLCEVITRFYKKRLLTNVVRASPLFGLLPPAMQERVVDCFQVQSFEPGELLLEQDKPGKGLFMLLRGTCEAFHRRVDGAESPYPAMHEGDVFGELSLLHDGIATASVRTVTRCVVLELRREWFDELLLANPAVRERIYAIAGERAQRTRDLVARESLVTRLI